MTYDLKNVNRIRNIKKYDNNFCIIIKDLNEKDREKMKVMKENIRIKEKYDMLMRRMKKWD